jgi:hypothetical protein
MSQKYVVRVVLPDGIHGLTEDTRQLLRFLNRAGVIVLHRDDPEGVCFDLVPPAGVEDSRVWAASVSMWDEYSFNAVVAPACPRK